MLNDVSSEVTIRTLPLFLANVLGVRTATIGMIEGIGESVSTLLKTASGSLADRLGLKKPLAKNDSILLADSPWSIYAWVKPAEALKLPSLVAGLGDPEDEFSRYLALSAQNLILWMGKDNSLFATVSLTPWKWHFIAATFDGDEFRMD